MNATVPSELPGRLWELLRRNLRFRRAVAGMVELREQLEGPDVQWAYEAGVRRLNVLRERVRNDFAVTALRWLTGRLVFQVTEIGRNAKGKSVQLRASEGWTPQPDDPSWKWFESGPVHLAGETDPRDRASYRLDRVGRLTWGPAVTTTRSKDPGLTKQCHDHVSEWQAHQGEFTVGTPWAEAPPGFRRAFTGAWNDLTGGWRQGKETGFFRRDLMKLAGSLARRNLSVEDHAALIEFQDLARCRVFAVPRVLQRREVWPLFKKLAAAVKQALPHQGDLLGPPMFWAALLAVEKLKADEKLSDKRAVQRYIERDLVAPKVAKAMRKRKVPEAQWRRWCPEGRMLPRPTNQVTGQVWVLICDIASPVIREAKRPWSGQIPRRLEYMRRLIRATFPRLDLDKLLSRAPS